VDARLRSLPALRVRIGRRPPEPVLALRSEPVALRPVEAPPDPGAPRIETGLDRVRAFYGERAGVTFSYRVSAPEAVSVQIELVHSADGQVVQAWPQPSVPLGQVQSVTWKGTAAGGVAPDGRYAFRLTARGSGGAQARSAQAAEETRDAFDFRQGMFPIRGRHAFGGAGARFAAGRGGRSHQGQDVFASCGTRLVAARGGTVEFVQYHAAAGHYLVIDGDGSDEHYVYMHLQGPPPVRRGQRVYTGQPIGAVGDSGNAVGCHLHFELWGAPGWYRGGRPRDPMPALRAWDPGS
jgi:murein DD-endopeptidase MepM/ murein hydrolase activator NlpD